MAALLKLRSITEPLRLEYDATHYVSHVVGSDGSYTITPKGTSGVVMPVKFGQQDGIILQFPTSEVGRNFNVTLKSFPNDPAAGGRVDSVLRIGYNVGPGGGPATAGEHALAIEMENYWYQAGQGIWTEFHAAYTSKNDAATRRLWSWLIDVDADTCQMYFQSGSYDFRDFSGGGDPVVSMLSMNSTRVSTPLSFRAVTNGATALYGYGSGSVGEIPIARVTGDNVVELGSSTYGTLVPKTLTVGASTAGAQAHVSGSADAAIASLVLLHNVGSSAGTGAVVECIWGNPATKLRFGAKNGDTFIVDSYGSSTWTNRLTLSNAGLLTLTGGLTCAGAITQTAVSPRVSMKRTSDASTPYLEFLDSIGSTLGYVGVASSAGTGFINGGAGANHMVIRAESSDVILAIGTTQGLTLDSAYNVVVGYGALATTATNGFLYIPSCAGTPTGVPTAYTGRVPLHYDATNHKLYIYDSGWKGVVVS